ncbi:MAG: pyridoxamine 5'-phosphate oxidase family protein [Bdellovibrionales bacterium]|jgi:general stress protein 26
MKNAKKTVGDFIDRLSVCVMTSVDKDGFPHTKAMRPRKRDGIKHIYFSTNALYDGTERYLENPKACVYFFTEDKAVLLIGTMEVLSDKASKKMIWKTSDEQYYTKGMDDPDIRVLKFTAQSGRYYGDGESEDFAVELT